MINLDKLELVPVGYVGDVEAFTHILGCKVAYLLMKHLGLILGASYEATSIWNDITEKMECCLPSWKRLYLR